MAHGSPAASAGRSAAQMPAAALPVTGSRVSGSRSSSPTARTSGPKSSASISSRYRFSTGFLLLLDGRSILPKTAPIFGGLFAQIQPIKEGVRRLQPDSEPLQNFLFLVAFVRVDARVAGNHFGPAPAQPGHLQHAFGRGALAFGTELAPKLIEAHQADFRLFQSRKTEKVPEFLFILALCIGLSGQYDEQPGSGENFGDVVRRGLPGRP